MTNESARSAFESAATENMPVNTTDDDNNGAVEARTDDIEPTGIGGWLLLPAFGLLVKIILGTLGLTLLVGQYAQVASAGYGVFFATYLAIGFGMLVFTVYGAVLFFKKKRNAPRVIIGLIIATLLADGAIFMIMSTNHYSGHFMHSLSRAVEEDLFKEIFSAAIWISYFLVSKRVKATFVN